MRCEFTIKREKGEFPKMGSVFSGWTGCGGTEGNEGESGALTRRASPFVRQRKRQVFCDDVDSANRCCFQRFPYKSEEHLRKQKLA